MSVLVSERPTEAQRKADIVKAYACIAVSKVRGHLPRFLQVELVGMYLDGSLAQTAPKLAAEIAHEARKAAGV